VWFAKPGLNVPEQYQEIVKRMQEGKE